MEREQLTKFKNIADKILEELGYGNSKEIILDRKEASVWGYINQNTENSLYYIVSTCKEQDFYNIDFEELQAEIFKGIKGLFAQETGIEKNLFCQILNMVIMKKNLILIIRPDLTRNK